MTKIADLITAAKEAKPGDVHAIVRDILADKVRDALEVERVNVASTFLTQADETNEDD